MSAHWITNQLFGGDRLESLLVIIMLVCIAYVIHAWATEVK